MKSQIAKVEIYSRDIGRIDKARLFAKKVIKAFSRKKGWMPTGWDGTKKWKLENKSIFS